MIFSCLYKEVCVVILVVLDSKLVGTQADTMVNSDPSNATAKYFGWHGSSGKQLASSSTQLLARSVR